MHFKSQPSKFVVNTNINTRTRTYPLYAKASENFENNTGAEENKYSGPNLS